jgi:hypothetical protein
MAVGCQPPASPRSGPLPERAVGVSYGHSPELIDEYEAWLGRDVDAVMVFLLTRSPDDLVESARAVAERFKGAPPETMIFSTPMVTHGQDLGDVLDGSNDRMYREVARILVRAGRGDDVIRLGWELNLRVHGWSAVDQWDRYARAYRRVVKVMRSVKGADGLQFEWNVARGGQAVPDAAYPGDAYVDVIGMDIYDRTYGAANADPVTRWDNFYGGEPGLSWLVDFARRHGKPIGFSEWGLSSRHPAGVDPDNTLFIERMHDFIESNNVAYSIYFERDTDFDHRLTRHYPKAAERYRELFG